MTPNWFHEMLTLEQAAKELNIAPNTFRAIVRGGEIVPIMVGTRPRFTRWMIIVWQAKKAKLLDVNRLRELFNFVEAW